MTKVTIFIFYNLVRQLIVKMCYQLNFIMTKKLRNYKLCMNMNNAFLGLLCPELELPGKTDENMRNRRNDKKEDKFKMIKLLLFQYSSVVP